MKDFDTICAIATALGEGGIAIIRVSGDKALDIVSKVFKAHSGQDIKTMKSLLKDIIEIKPIINQSYEYEHVDMREKTMKELFVEYYKFRNKVEPKGELLDLFLQIVEEEGDDN